ncbi:DUF982 domain-containing protein [Rhizobium herbae]|uniref:DUF982 domain-containing protein n=1 Tax=Rhizobium herbae TaxID=508661 RepID=A0ABS4EVS2_9HYPH|nr:DUF982 domain-containing protein [Rhizobium herbae]MBP1862061.1 hypothetical protein [Rhizobium herbae]
MNNDSIWDVNVELAIECSDHFRVVRNAREAMACLTTSWPEIKGSRHAVARQACLAALEGTKTNAEARIAFEAAAEEAGILKRN